MRRHLCAIWPRIKLQYSCVMKASMGLSLKIPADWFAREISRQDGVWGGVDETAGVGGKISTTVDFTGTM